MISVRLRIYDHSGEGRQDVTLTGGTLLDALWSAVRAGYVSMTTHEAFHVLEVEGDPPALHWIGYAWHTRDPKYRWRDAILDEDTLREMVMARLSRLEEARR